MTSLFAAALSFYPRCAISTYDFTFSWTAVIVSFFVSLVGSLALDLFCREDDTFLTLFWVPLGWLFPVAFQYALDAVTCNAAGSLIKDPSVQCPVGSTVSPIGGFSIFFIMGGLCFKFFKAWKHSKPEARVFYAMDVIRSCMTAASNANPRVGAFLLFWLSILQLALCLCHTLTLREWRTAKEVNVFGSKRDSVSARGWFWVDIYSPFHLQKNPQLAYISFLTIVIEIVLLKVVFAGSYDLNSGLALGIILIILVLAAFCYMGVDFWRIFEAHSNEYTLRQSDLSAAHQFHVRNPLTVEKGLKELGRAIFE